MESKNIVKTKNSKENDDIHNEKSKGNEEKKTCLRSKDVNDYVEQNILCINGDMHGKEEWMDLTFSEEWHGIDGQSRRS